ncbi:YlzJ-like family protein [Gracilibacillus dipsosauri]|uniref:YlzJ-like family protein n=1 Tax=Gracilibacillus dipsosauri TaxID=178340 RepID=UPI002409C64E
MSMDDIFPEDEKEYEKHKWVEVDGRLMKVLDLEDGNHVLTQILSTNPNDYLTYNPGTMIKL